MLDVLQSKTFVSVFLVYTASTIALIFGTISPDEWKEILFVGMGAMGLRGLGEGIGKAGGKKE